MSKQQEQKNQTQIQSVVELPKEGLCTAEQLSALIPVVPGTIRRWAKQGKFPQPVRLPSMRVFWNVADVREWIAKQTFSEYTPKGGGIERYRCKRSKGRPRNAKNGGDDVKNIKNNFIS